LRPLSEVCRILCMFVFSSQAHSFAWSVFHVRFFGWAPQTLLHRVLFLIVRRVNMGITHPLGLSFASLFCGNGSLGSDFSHLLRESPKRRPGELFGVYLVPPCKPIHLFSSSWVPILIFADRVNPLVFSIKSSRWGEMSVPSSWVAASPFFSLHDLFFPMAYFLFLLAPLSVVPSARVSRT